MKVCDFITYLSKYNLPLSYKYELVAYMLNISYDMAKSAYNEEIDDSLVDDISTRLSNNEPVAYIVGVKEFYGREFKVTKDTLIPRVETEILIDKVLEYADASKEYNILDLCSGSGAIGLTLALELNKSNVTLVELSKDTIKVSKENAERFNITKQISFICGDALSFKGDTLFDIVVCNPPYISEDEYLTLEKEVYYEPKTALVAEDNGLLFYKNILNNIKFLCKNNGALFFEIGYNQKKDIVDYATSLNLHAECFKDYAGNDRVIKVIY